VPVSACDGLAVAVQIVSVIRAHAIACESRACFQILLASFGRVTIKPESKREGNPDKT